MVLVKLKWNKLTFDNVDVSVDEGVQVKKNNSNYNFHSFIIININSSLLIRTYHFYYISH